MNEQVNRETRQKRAIRDFMRSCLALQKEEQAYFRRYDNCWSKGILSYSKEMITEASRREFLEKLSLRHIQEDGEDYSFTYEKLTEGGIIYLQARISFVHEKDGGLVAVVGTRNVDDLIKKERQQEMALQAAFDAAEAAKESCNQFQVRRIYRYG